MSDAALDVDVDALDGGEIPHPPHSWATAKRCIRNACAVGEHDWVELTGLDELAYWRECRECGLADVTAQALGQRVETPYAGQQENKP